MNPEQFQAVVDNARHEQNCTSTTETPETLRALADAEQEAARDTANSPAGSAKRAAHWAYEAELRARADELDGGNPAACEHGEPLPGPCEKCDAPRCDYMSVRLGCCALPIGHQGAHQFTHRAAELDRHIAELEKDSAFRQRVETVGIVQASRELESAGNGETANPIRAAFHEGWGNGYVAGSNSADALNSGAPRPFGHAYATQHQDWLDSEAAKETDQLGETLAALRDSVAVMESAVCHARDPGDEQGSRADWNIWERDQAEFEQRRDVALSTARAVLARATGGKS